MAAVLANNISRLFKVKQDSNHDRIAILPGNNDPLPFIYNYDDSIMANFVIQAQKDKIIRERLIPHLEQLRPILHDYINTYLREYRVLLDQENPLMILYIILNNHLLYLENILISVNGGNITVDSPLYNCMIRIIILSFLCNTDFFYNMMILDTANQDRDYTLFIERLFEALCKSIRISLNTNIVTIIQNLIVSDISNTYFNELFLRLYRDNYYFFKFIINTHVGHLYNFPISFNGNGQIFDLDYNHIELQIDYIDRCFTEFMDILDAFVVESNSDTDDSNEEYEQVDTQHEENDNQSVRTPPPTKKRHARGITQKQKQPFVPPSLPIKGVVKFKITRNKTVPFKRASSSGTGLIMNNEGGGTRRNKKLNKLKTKKQRKQHKRKRNAAIRPTKTRSAPRRLRRVLRRSHATRKAAPRTRY